MTPARAQMTRRGALGLGLAAATAVTVPLPAGAAQAAVASSAEALEAEYAVTLGLVARNLSTGRSLAHRATTRFPVLSTFKAIVVAAVLDRRSPQVLGRTVRIAPEDVVVNSPITSLRREMTVAELCDAALRYSDNTAGNKLLELVGGPRGLTAYARSIGDRTFRLDRWEPTLNSAVPGDERDTSTPEAMAATYQRLLLGDALRVQDRWQLRAWMQGSKTSASRLGAGLDPTWTLADKTGAGDYATLNSVGIVVVPDGTTLVVSALSRTDDPARTADNNLMRDVARLVVAQLT